MATPITFGFVYANPPLRIQFKEGPGQHTKKAVLLIVTQGSPLIIASAGIDANNCTLFEALYDLGTHFCGNFYKDKKIAGHFVISKETTGKGVIKVEVNKIRAVLHLSSDDVADLKALFKKIGEEL